MRKYLIISKGLLFRGTNSDIYGTKAEFRGTDSDFLWDKNGVPRD